MHGVQGFVKTRILKRSYGLAHRIDFDEIAHKGRPFTRSPFDDTKYLDDYVKWIATRVKIRPFFLSDACGGLTS